VVKNSGGAAAQPYSENITVAPQSQVQGLELSPASVTGANPSTGTITLTAAAPSGGLTVSLSSSDSAVASTPSSVNVPASQKSATFQITTSSVSSERTVTISAAGGGATTTADLTVKVPPPALSQFSISPGAITGGGDATGTVTLTSPSCGCSTVSLISNAPSAVQVPVSVDVPVGSATVTFPITTSSVSSNTIATLTASLGGVSKQATLEARVSNPVLDQRNNNVLTNLFSLDVPTTGFVAQEFKPTLPNLIRLRLKGNAVSGNSVTVSVHKGSTTAPALSEVTVTVTPGAGYADVVLPKPLAVAPGAVYIIRATRSSGPSISWDYGNNSYADGISYTDATPVPTRDFWFETYGSS